FNYEYPDICNETQIDRDTEMFECIIRSIPEAIKSPLKPIGDDEIPNVKLELDNIIYKKMGDYIYKFGYNPETKRIERLKFIVKKDIKIPKITKFQDLEREQVAREKTERLIK